MEQHVLRTESPAGGPLRREPPPTAPTADIPVVCSGWVATQGVITTLSQPWHSN